MDDRTAQWIVAQQQALDRLVAAGTHALTARRLTHVQEAITGHHGCMIPQKSPPSQENAGEYFDTPPNFHAAGRRKAAWKTVSVGTPWRQPRIGRHEHARGARKSAELRRLTASL